MGFGTWLFGQSGEAIAQPIDAIGNTLDKLFTSDEEKAQAAAVMEKLRQAPDILQHEINKIQAGHSSVFVAGPRPFIMWVCGFAFAVHFILFPILNFGLGTFGLPQIAVSFDMDTLMTTLYGILGLGLYRTAEKVKGVAR